jgi:hypothetical protein
MLLEKVLKAVATLRRDASKLSAAAQCHHRDAATPAMAGAFRRLQTLTEDFGHGLQSAVAARQSALAIEAR